MKRQILTTIVVLLMLTVHISAQVRNAEVTLKGLSNIGLIVNYGQIDGLPEEMRPSMLLMLQDRARDLLRQAKVPLLESTDEADIVRRPRLVFTVNVRKQTATNSAIDVESKLYERVRLWRDPTKEMELATWYNRDWGGVSGAKYRDQMVFDLFEREVDGFVTRYRVANPNAKQVEHRTPEPPAQLRDNANSLEGVNGINLLIRSMPGAPADARASALSKMLQAETEKKLKQAGIPLLRSVQETERVGRPLLYLSVHVSPLDSPAPIIKIESTFWQRVLPVRDPEKNIDAVTWESRADEKVQPTDEAVLRIMNSQLDEFIKVYNAANRKLSSTSN